MNPIPNRTVQIDPFVSEKVLVSLCDHAGIEVQESFDRDGMAELLRACGYDVVPGTVAEFVRKKYIADPPEGQWTAPFIHAMTAALECRRRWLPTPNPKHDAKKSAMRLEIERLRGEGIDPPIHDIDSTTLEDLLIQLATSEQRMHREALLEAVLVKCETLGFREE